MSDYIKRLEAGLAMAARYGIGGVELGEDGASISFEDLRSLLSDVERMREWLEKIERSKGSAPHMRELARQALAAPTPGGTHD